MRLRRILAGTVAGLGAVAAANRLLVADELPPPLGREPRTYQWRGFDVSYTEAGDPDDRDLLLLHGVDPAASSHEFAPLVDDVAASHHVLAPDLPGFGRSDRPPLSYSGSLYEAFVADFARDLTDDAVCVATGLSGAYAALAAPRVELAELVTISPPAAPGRRPWLRTLLRAPFVGQAAFNVLVSRPALRYALADRSVADPSRVPAGYVDYRWRTAHRPGARFAPAAGLAGYLHPDPDLGEILGEVDGPVTIVAGREATAPPVSLARRLAERAGARLLVFEDAADRPHVEHPGEFGSLLSGAPPVEA